MRFEMFFNELEFGCFNDVSTSGELDITTGRTMQIFNYLHYLNLEI